MLGHREQARAEYLSALALDGNLVTAHLGLSKLGMPGAGYEAWLERLHEALRPDTYVEIGVSAGVTLALARPPTRVFGVDPAPRVTARLRAETHLFAETSDAFFAHRRLEGPLGGRPVALAFIDGLHTFEQCLRDVINLETYCGPRSVVLLHDTVPLDEPTQRRERATDFWTGDVWKAVLALKHCRPDLDILTIATAPTGLTMVTGLDPSSRVQASAYDEAVTRLLALSFGEVTDRLEEPLNIAPNDWDVVVARLRARGIL